MEELTTVLGSETEFGLVSRGEKRERRLIKDIECHLSRGRLYKTEKILRIVPFINMWGEDMKRKESIGDGRSYADDVIRRLGLSGEHMANGARLYVDCTHLEYSTPECLTPYEAICYERAGEAIAYDVLKEVMQSSGDTADLLKRNWDYGRASYACHENYLVSRDLFSAITRLKIDDKDNDDTLDTVVAAQEAIWLMYLISRVFLIGSGRFNPDFSSHDDILSLSQRQPFIYSVKSNSTTEERPLINLRDRPYADPKIWGRLHVIPADSNRSDWSNLLKYGTARLVLLWLENLSEIGIPPGYKRFFPIDPVKAFRSIRDEATRIETKHGFTEPIAIQRFLLENVVSWLEWLASHEGKIVSWAGDIIQKWEWSLLAFENQRQGLEDKLDWLIKKRLFKEEVGKGASRKQLHSLDYHYHVTGQDSLFEHLVREGSIVSICSEEEIRHARSIPPKSRATIRSALQKEFSDEALPPSVSWHQLIIWKKRGYTGIVMPDPRTNEANCDDAVMKERIEKCLLEIQP